VANDPKQRITAVIAAIIFFITDLGMDDVFRNRTAVQPWLLKT